jgi:hypothetical protein
MPFSKSEKFVNNGDDDDVYDDEDDSCPLGCNVVQCLVDNYRIWKNLLHSYLHPSEKLVYVYQIPRCHIPEESYLYSKRREDHKSQICSYSPLWYSPFCCELVLTETGKSSSHFTKLNANYYLQMNPPLSHSRQF